MISKTYDSKSKMAFKLSRTKIENFIKCPRCFYLDRKLGIGQPPGFPFTLNSAVDCLLKKEFDVYRAEQKIHPLMQHYGLKAVPFRDEKMGEWRENFVGVQALHKPTNFLVFGAVDDIWINEDKELIVVDYKATSSETAPTLDADYRQSYKRQMEVYQ
jgi:RecB family exonuclease